VLLSQPATRVTSAGANSDPLSDATPDSYPAPSPESDAAEPLDPEAAPELLVLDPDPELDPESEFALS